MRLPDLVLPASDGSTPRLLSLVAERPATVLVLLRHFG